MTKPELQCKQTIIHMMIDIFLLVLQNKYLQYEMKIKMVKPTQLSLHNVTSKVNTNMLFILPGSHILFVSR